MVVRQCLRDLISLVIKIIQLSKCSISNNSRSTRDVRLNSRTGFYPKTTLATSRCTSTKHSTTTGTHCFRQVEQNLRILQGAKASSPTRQCQWLPTITPSGSTMHQWHHKTIISDSHSSSISSHMPCLLSWHTSK